MAACLVTALLAVACGAPAEREAAPAADSAAPSLDELYQQARREGGKVVVWAGGDAPNQADWIKTAFEKRFPGVTADITVDLSKFHDARIDEQLKAGTLVPDVAHLQTVQDFPRWKSEGALLNFKPQGFDQLWPQFTDPDGAYLPVYMFAFLPEVNAKLVPGTQTPTGYGGFLTPTYRNKLVLTWPQDDDAVLYVYDKIVKKSGESFLAKLAAQKPTWVRGTAVPAEMVGTRDYLGNLTGNPTGRGAPARSFIPATDPFLVWPQTSAIFKQAKHPAAAKLYLSWMISKEFQENYPSWRVRMDVPPPPGYKQFTDYPNTNPADFIAFMRDRTRVETARKQMERYFGPVTGPSPLTDPRLLKILGISR